MSTQSPRQFLDLRALAAAVETFEGNEFSARGHVGMIAGAVVDGRRGSAAGWRRTQPRLYRVWYSYEATRSSPPQHLRPRERSSSGRILQHKAQHFLRNWRVPHRRERLPVQRRRPVLAQRREVTGRAVSLVRGESIDGKDRIPRSNHAVAFHLRNDRRGRDRGRERVAVNDRPAAAVRNRAAWRPPEDDSPTARAARTARSIARRDA